LISLLLYKQIFELFVELFKVELGHCWVWLNPSCLFKALWRITAHVFLAFLCLEKRCPWLWLIAYNFPLWLLILLFQGFLQNCFFDLIQNSLC
jgi:hypothetical protein